MDGRPHGSSIRRGVSRNLARLSSAIRQPHQRHAIDLDVHLPRLEHHFVERQSFDGVNLSSSPASVLSRSASSDFFSSSSLSRLAWAVACWPRSVATERNAGSSERRRPGRPLPRTLSTVSAMTQSIVPMRAKNCQRCELTRASAVLMRPSRLASFVANCFSSSRSFCFALRRGQRFEPLPEIGLRFVRLRASSRPGRTARVSASLRGRDAPPAGGGRRSSSSRGPVRDGSAANVPAASGSTSSVEPLVRHFSHPSQMSSGGVSRIGCNRWHSRQTSMPSDARVKCTLPLPNRPGRYSSV